MAVHGDDFTAAGPKCELDWYEGQLSAQYELTIQPRVGPGPDDAKEALVLNRIVRWSDEGIEYEADPRQGEKFIAECGLTGANSVVTPSSRMSSEELEKDIALEERWHTAYRAAAARTNYLSTDRIDLQFAAKEV